MERVRAFIPSNCASHNHQPYRHKAFACPVRLCYPSSVGVITEKKKRRKEEQRAWL